MGSTIPYFETFSQSTQYKARKLLLLQKVYKRTEGEYVVMPILGYNTTEYTVKEIMGKFMCTCQKGRGRGHCSHMLAVYLFIEKTEGIKERQLQFL